VKDDLTVTNSVWFLAALGIDPVDHRTPPISIESNLEVSPSGKHHGGTILDMPPDACVHVVPMLIPSSAAVYASARPGSDPAGAGGRTHDS